MMSLTAAQLSELTAQFFLAGLGTLSFAILFACPRRCLPYCALVGAVGWLWYELLTLLGADAATASLLSVTPLTILTRVFAITQKTPVTVFLLTGIFPLVPGAGIYYTAYHFIQNENTLALAKGISTFKIAVALAVGISFAALSVDIAFSAALIGITTFVLSVAGVFVGNYFGSRYERPAGIVGGIVLILIGLKVLLEHLGILAL